MDYKEKLEEAKRLYETANADQKYVLESLFPELRESDDERVRKELIKIVNDHYSLFKEIDRAKTIAWLEKQGEVESDNDDIEVEEKGIREAFNKIEDEKQCKQKPQRMISAEAKEAMYNKPADTVEPKCEESKTKIFDAPTPFEDKLYAFVLACEILVDPSKREFILEHSQEILDAAREQIGKEQSSTWSEEDEKEYKYVLKFVDNILNNCGNKKDYEHCKRCYNWLKSLRPQNNITDEELAQAKKDAYNDALDKIEYHSGEPTFDDGWSAAIWYLKKKNAMPQTQWKPSDEQLEALKNAIHIKPLENPSDSLLWGLYEQLKKLKS